MAGLLVSRPVSQLLGSLVVSLFSGRLLVSLLLDQLSGPLVVRLFSGWLWVAQYLGLFGQLVGWLVDSWSLGNLDVSLFSGRLLVIGSSVFRVV